MQFVHRTVPANFNLFLFGDVHIGTLLHYEAGFDQFIDTLQNPYDGVKHNIAIGMGDYIEAIDHSDRRFDVHSVDLQKIRPEQQMDAFIEKIKPVRKKIITLLDGNHEYKLVKYHNYVQYACDRLRIPYGTYTAVTTFARRDEGHMFKAFVTHGNGQINSIADDPERLEANLNLSLKRKLKDQQGDCLVMAMGHTHKLLVARPKKKLYLTSSGNDMEQHYTKSEQTAQYIHPDHRYYINTGSFLRLYLKGISGYAERALYKPMEMGFAVVKVRDCKVTEVEKIFI